MDDKIRDIYRWLLERYGEPEDPRKMDGVDWVIETIMSQNTNDVNRDKAFKKLKERYGDDYGAVERSDTDELADTIRIAGLAPTKAERIQNTLSVIRQKSGDYSIDFLEDMDVDEAKGWLTDIPGIGPKTAAVIICFYFGKPVFPVDTHVHRLCKRYGLVPENASRERTHEIMEEKVPDEIKYPFHRLLIEHGRNDCKATNKDCECGLCKRYG